MAPSQKKINNQGLLKSESIISDPRFANLHTDPRYKLPSKKHTRIKLDNRFAHVLKDDEFSRRARVDRYGRKINKSAGRNHLRRFYRLEDEEEAANNDDEVARELDRIEKTYDPAREGGFSSSSDESDSEVDEQDTKFGEEQTLQEKQLADVPMGEVSSRLAAVNLDWDNVRAVDVMAVASSFAPSDGRILKVSIYPSEFGKDRIEREELEGPPRAIFANKGMEDSEDEDLGTRDEESYKRALLTENSGEEFDSSALRTYQLERLRYYYAVLTCSDISTAKALYDSMDGREYLSSANFFDLRFIPDNVSFKSDKPRDECDEIPDGYRPNEFVTDALTHSKVKLTWDADDQTRKEVQRRAFSRADIDDNDLRAYIGNDSSSESEAEAEVNRAIIKTSKATAIRAALGLVPDSGKHKATFRKQDRSGPISDMQVTFASGLSDTVLHNSVLENDPLTEETTKEKYIRKEKERKTRRKEKAKASRTGSKDSDAIMPKDIEPADSLVPTSKDDHCLPDVAFDDPFFREDNEMESLAKVRESRLKEKADKRAMRETEENTLNSKREEMKLLMTDDTSSHVKHFDMNEIVKSEKARRKSKRKKDLINQSGDSGSHQDGFNIDVQDPRFSILWDNHEYAIDPTNPRFQSTQGMKTLLDTWKKRKLGHHVDSNDPVPRELKRRNISHDTTKNSSEDIKKLVERVKGKTRKD